VLGRPLLLKLTRQVGQIPFPRQPHTLSFIDLMTTHLPLPRLLVGRLQREINDVRKGSDLQRLSGYLQTAR
jgi:hypothetical protein